MRFRLSDEDREKLGAPEVIEYDQLHLSTEDAELLEAEGVDWTAWGSLRVAGLRSAVWLALRRDGKERPFAEVQFDLRQVRVEAESPGKAPSAKSASPTRSRSATSRTGTSRRKA